MILILQLANFTFQTVDHVLLRVRFDDRRIFDVLRPIGITKGIHALILTQNGRRNTGDLRTRETQVGRHDTYGALPSG